LPFGVFLIFLSRFDTIASASIESCAFCNYWSIAFCGTLLMEENELPKIEILRTGNSTHWRHKLLRTLITSELSSVQMPTYPSKNSARGKHRY